MLLALRDYLVECKAADVREIAWHFKQEPELIRDWLQHWIRKGRVQRAQASYGAHGAHGCSARCPGCSNGCTRSSPEIYAWM